jgi:hypothetical protein
MNKLLSPVYLKVMLSRIPQLGKAEATFIYIPSTNKVGSACRKYLCT